MIATTSSSNTGNGCSVSLGNDKYEYLGDKIYIVGKKNCGATTLIINEIYRIIRSKINNVFVINDYPANNLEYNYLTDTIYKSSDIGDIVNTLKSSPQQNHLVIFDTISEKLINNNLIDLFSSDEFPNVTVIFRGYGHINTQLRDECNLFYLASSADIRYIKSLFDCYFGDVPLPILINRVKNLSRFEFIVGALETELVIVKPVDGREHPKKFINNLSIIVNKQQNCDMVIDQLSPIIDELINLRNTLKSIK